MRYLPSQAIAVGIFTGERYSAITEPSSGVILKIFSLLESAIHKYCPSKVISSG